MLSWISSVRYDDEGLAMDFPAELFMIISTLTFSDAKWSMYVLEIPKI